jgi:hypothetical protein
MSRFSLVRGRVARVTVEDGCGNRVLGPTNSITTKGFTTVAYTAVTNTGEAINVTNANGDDCVVDTPVPKFTGYTVNITFCQVDPELYSALTGNPVVYAADGETVVGFDVNDDVDQSDSAFGLEVWSKVPQGSCAGGSQGYGYFLSPFLQGGIVGDFTIENNAVTFQVTGAQTKGGNAWGVGPYDVVLDDSDVPGPLNTALSTRNHLHMELTTVPPPDDTGAGELGVAATGATAGIPATLTPTNSYAPADLAGLSTVTATPNTAWTTGQYVQLRDGSTAHWDGSAWVAGAA